MRLRSEIAESNKLCAESWAQWWRIVGWREVAPVARTPEIVLLVEQAMHHAYAAGWIARENTAGRE